MSIAVGWQPTDGKEKWFATLEGLNKPRVHGFFDPFRVGPDLPRCSVGCTHGYSHFAPFGAEPAKRDVLIQQAVACRPRRLAIA
ncbi:MAG: hypothetical protein ABI651_18045 [Verrucomicrobiota bacterium]